MKNIKPLLRFIGDYLQRYRVYIFLIGALFVILFSDYKLGFRSGFEQGAAAWKDLRKQNMTLTQLSEQCHRDLISFKHQNVELKQDKAIDKHSYEGLMKTLDKLQKTNAKLQGENQLYRKILTPEQQQAGIQINSVQIFPLKQPGKFRYEILLVKFSNHKKMTPGAMQLSVQGIQDDEVIQLPFEVLSNQWKEGQPYEVRYFQTLQGEIQLPVGFNPESIQISLNNKGNSQQKPIQDEFPWLVSIG